MRDPTLSNPPSLAPSSSSPSVDDDDCLFIRRPVMHNRPYLDGGRREAQSTGDLTPKRARRRVKDASKGVKSVTINPAARALWERSATGTGSLDATTNAAREGIQNCV